MHCGSLLAFILLLAVMVMLCFQVGMYTFGNGVECLFSKQLSWYSVPSFTSCLHDFVFVFVFKCLYQLRFKSGKTAPQIESRPAVEDLLNCRGGRITSGCKYQHIGPKLVGVA